MIPILYKRFKFLIMGFSFRVESNLFYFILVCMYVTSGIRAAFIRSDPNGQLKIYVVCVPMHKDNRSITGNIMRRGTTKQPPQDTGEPQTQPY